MNRVTKLLLGAVFVLLTFVQTAKGQTGTVTVQVLDAEGPIIGASVLIKGTTTGNVTNNNGEVVLNNVSAASVLQISFVGYVSQEVPVGTRSRITVTLQEEVFTLGEMVVIGYGIQRKSQVTGSISQVSSEDLENRAVTNVTQTLAGKTAGVQIFLQSGQPGIAGDILIRGMGSNSSNIPLYVVDGRRVSDINYLDPDDIQSMEILKDASAAAIYGARAGNGVVLITTKQGSSKAKGTVNYSFMTSWQTKTNVPKMLNAQEFYDYQTTLSSANQSALEADWGNKTTDTDWLNYIFGTGRMNRHNLSLSGGVTDVTYYVAFSSNINDGPMIGIKDKYERYTGTFNSEYQVKKWLKFTTNNNISYIKSYGGFNQNNDNSAINAIFGATMRMSPLYTPTVPEPTTHMLGYVSQGYNLIKHWDGTYATLPVFSTGDSSNPMVTLNRTNAYSSNTRLNGTSAFIFTPITSLTVTSRFAYFADSPRAYTQTLPGINNTQAASYNQSVSAMNRSSEGLQWENFANYTNSFGKHNTTIMAGMSFIENRSAFVTGTVSGTGRDIGFPNIDPKFAYFAYKSGAYSQVVEGGEEVIERQIAYFGRINYDFDNKYFIQASLRADAADLSQLPKNGRWGYFPAASFGWTISNEDFMQDFKQISHLRLRASWGQNGSTAGLRNYSWQSVIQMDGVYSFIPNQMTYVSARRPSTAGNDGLKWETSEQSGIGFDIRLLNNKLAFTYDWYKKTTKDLIITGITPSYIMGINASPFNAGKVENVGHEFELTYRNQVGKDFSYSIKGNFTTLKNEVKEITSSLKYISGASYDSHVITWFEQGYPMWHFKTFKFTGVDANGNPTFYDLNGNGVIDSDDKVDCGSGIPTHSYGLTLTANYKNFDFTVFGAGQGGHKYMQTVTRVFQRQANVPTYIFENAWTETNRNTNVPKVNMDNVGYYFVSDAQIFKADYFKIKQLQIGYFVPQNITRKIQIDRLRIYAASENLLTLTKYPGFDPEIQTSGNSLGVDTGRYPSSRNFIIGLNVTF